jgi:hypothetical protein
LGAADGAVDAVAVVGERPVEVGVPDLDAVVAVTVRNVPSALR